LRNPVADPYNDAERNGHCYSHGNGDSYTDPNIDSKGYPHTKVHSPVAASPDSAASPVVGKPA
jgi:hypothetical protein